jgi:hypothetical protein
MAIAEVRLDEQEWAFMSGTFRALSHTFLLVIEVARELEGVPSGSAERKVSE